MGWLITKYLLTAAVVVIVSEVAKRSDKLGGFIAALPLITFLALIWLYIEKQPQARISNHAWYTFWYVVPTLPMFLVFPLLWPRLGFWLTMLASIGITVLCFGLFAGIPAIILGHIAHLKIRREPQKYKGAGFAITGFTLGYLSILTTIALYHDPFAGMGLR
ncbi:MAG: DUF4190 domain-containing protein [Pseudoxanthomonas sp.]